MSREQTALFGHDGLQKNVLKRFEFGRLSLVDLVQVVQERCNVVEDILVTLGLICHIASKRITPLEFALLR